MAPIIKAFVDKQRRVRHDNNYAAVDKDGHPIELTGIWSDGAKGETEGLQAGTMELPTVTSSFQSEKKAVCCASTRAELATGIH